MHEEVSLDEMRKFYLIYMKFKKKNKRTRKCSQKKYKNIRLRSTDHHIGWFTVSSSLPYKTRSNISFFLFSFLVTREAKWPKQEKPN